MIPTLHRARDATDVVELLAAFLVARVTDAIARRGRCRLALAGGGTPRSLYERLTRAPWRDRIDWSRLDIFWGDERAVPADHPQSNYRLAREALLDAVPVPARNVHRIDGELPPDQAARGYAAALGNEPLDLILLGMGGDGHTASLFPGTPLDRARDQTVLATRSPVPPVGRVSLGYGALEAARCVAFLVVGAGKAERVAEVMRQLGVEDGDREVSLLPAALVRPISGELHWFVDEAAFQRVGADG